MKKRNGIFGDISKVVITTIITTLITTVISQGFVFYFWKLQFATNRAEKIQDYKLELIDEFSNTTFKHIFLSEFTTRLKLEQYQEEAKLADSLFAVSNLRLDTLDADIRYKVQLLLMKKHPLLYENHLKFLEHQGSFISTATRANILFSSDIDVKINELVISFSEMEIRKRIKDDMNLSANRIAYSIQKDRIANELTFARIEMVQKIVNYMIDEVSGK